MIMSTLLTGLLIPACWLLSGLLWLNLIFTLIILSVWIIILQFFRNPNRKISSTDDFNILAPADGKVVVIEEIFEKEVLNQKCIQISIFMSPFNVHVNRHAVSGKISYYRYHPGKFLMAWNPKSSTDNERSTVVYETSSGKKVLVRQIAGFLARRIICYAKEGMQAVQGEELGFIRFGSRVDVLVPVGTKINVKIGDVVVGNKTVISML